MKTFRISIALCGLALIAVLGIGCTEESNPSDSIGAYDGLSLLGLEDGRQMIYLQTDTITNPDFSITVTTGYETVNIAGDNQDWIISNGDTALINLKVTAISVLQNGYWIVRDPHDSLVYFAVPPVMMTRAEDAEQPWYGYTPHLVSGGQETKLIWYYAYFGFYFEKRYQGRQLLHLPAGSYSTYHFRTGLYRNPVEGDPDVTVDEYYVPVIGLVQQKIRGGSLNRTLSLISRQ